MQKKKYKIAVEVSGHLRTFEYCAPLLKKNLLHHYDCDVFIHTWDRLDHQQLSWHGKPGSFGGHRPDAVTADIKKKVEHLYQPKAIIYDSEESIKKIDGFLVKPNKKTGFGGFSLQAAWNTLYTEVEAHRLMKNYAKKNNIKYDFIIRTRPDIGILEDFIIDPYLPFFDITGNSVVIFPLGFAFENPKHQPSKKFVIPLMPAWDVFFLTNLPTMDKMMKVLDDFDLLFKKLPTLWPDPKILNNIGVWGIENILIYYMQQLGIAYHVGKLHKVVKRFNAEKDLANFFADSPKPTPPSRNILRKIIVNLLPPIIKMMIIKIRNLLKK